MLRTPCSLPIDGPHCDPKSPQEALDRRLRNAPPLTTAKYLGSIHVTTWLYRDKQGVERIIVNPNTTIAELAEQFGPAETADAEVGIHSEGKAAEWFRTRPDLRVVQIFSERIPSARMCAPMLRHYFPGVPWFYYYDRNSSAKNRFSNAATRTTWPAAGMLNLSLSVRTTSGSMQVLSRICSIPNIARAIALFPSRRKTNHWPNWLSDHPSAVPSTPMRAPRIGSQGLIHGLSMRHAGIDFDQRTAAVRLISSCVRRSTGFLCQPCTF
jgi:hypothetical protein